MKTQLYGRLSALLTQHGFLRIHADSNESTARAALAALAGLPPYDQLWVGDLGSAVQIVAVASGERVPGVELARRAELLAERARALAPRVKGQVQVLQLVAYDRPVPEEERSFVLSKAKVASFWPFARGRVVTWLVTLDDKSVHANRFRGWPAELSPDALRALVG